VAKSSGIGLDIGSSAVRAAEVAGHGGHEEIVKFAQVGLPVGAVVEGEIRDPAAVSAALKRLWTEGGFTRRDVVLGVSSQRAMVRQIEVPQMSPNEMRSALRYQIGELLPIPVEQAVFDFAVLGPGQSGGDGGATTRLLVVAAQQDIVKEAIAVVKRAGLRVRAVDPSPLALLRAVPPSPGGGIEAVVSLGAHLVVVGVRQGTTPRFLRTVTSGNEASRDGAMETAGAVQASDGRRALGGAGASRRLEPVVEEVRSSIEFFLGHNQGEVLERVVVTGGAAQTEGLVDRIRAAVNVPVTLASVGPTARAAQLHLSEVQLKEASTRWTTAVGLALWRTGPGPAPSLLPEEIRQRRQFQQALAGSAVGVLVVALGLGVVSYSGARSASNVQNEIASDNAQAAALQVQINKLEVVTRVRSQVAAQRQLAVTALQGDVAWVSLVHRIADALPKGVTLTQMALTRTSLSTTPSPAAAGPANNSVSEPGYFGTISLSGQTVNGPKSVSQIIDVLSAVRGIGAVWVPQTAKTQSSGTSSGAGGNGASSSPSRVMSKSAAPGGTGSQATTPANDGPTTFTLNADITSAALSDRSADLPGGTK
jgi:type IV pilus assembly protein PilM